MRPPRAFLAQAIADLGMCSSVGHLIVDALALRLGIRLVSDKYGFVGQGTLNGRNITLFKSSKAAFTSRPLLILPTESLMNISGPSVAAVYRKTTSSPTSLVVITDSLLHPVETLSVKLGGSANGHNGVKSVITALGGETNFHRFRIGIGRNGTDAAEYVMQKLSSHERQFWANDGLDLVLSELENIALKTAS